MDRNIFDLRRILVPFDGSPGSIANLHYAGAIARAASAEMLVVYVLVLPTVTPLGVSLPAETQAEVEDVLAQADAIARQYALAPRLAVVDGRAVAETIIRVAEDEAVDTIIMALRHTHMRGETLILGATTRHVLQHAPCPVLISHTPSGHRQGARSP
jgi:nucleotide-binding universal stress UspA family protein